MGSRSGIARSAARRSPPDRGDGGGVDGTKVRAGRGGGSARNAAAAACNSSAGCPSAVRDSARRPASWSTSRSGSRVSIASRRPRVSQVSASSWSPIAAYSKPALLYSHTSSGVSARTCCQIGAACSTRPSRINNSAIRHRPSGSPCHPTSSARSMVVIASSTRPTVS